MPEPRFRVSVDDLPVVRVLSACTNTSRRSQRVSSSQASDPDWPVIALGFRGGLKRGTYPIRTSFETMSTTLASLSPRCSARMPLMIGSIPDDTRMTGIGGLCSTQNLVNDVKPGSSLMAAGRPGREEVRFSLDSPPKLSKNERRTLSENIDRLRKAKLLSNAIQALLERVPEVGAVLAGDDLLPDFATLGLAHAVEVDHVVV